MSPYLRVNLVQQYKGKCALLYMNYSAIRGTYKITKLRHELTKDFSIVAISINPLTSRISNFFGLLVFIICVTLQRSIGHDAPSYPPQVKNHKKVKFSGRDISSLAVKGLS